MANEITKAYAIRIEKLPHGYVVLEAPSTGGGRDNGFFYPPLAGCSTIEDVMKFVCSWLMGPEKDEARDG